MDNTPWYHGGLQRPHAAAAVVVAAAVVAAVLWRRRIAEWHDRYRTRRRLRYAAMRGDGGGFELDIESGLSSTTFDLQPNVDASDPRAGLLAAAASSVRQLMHAHGWTFDEARLQYFEAELARNAIGADGVPTDARTVTFGVTPAHPH
jgi:hypothetical protein